jgi:hypothetical protein
VAKDVFLETGYERASMDAVAARAGTSKRSLYAHALELWGEYKRRLRVRLR